MIVQSIFDQFSDCLDHVGGSLDIRLRAPGHPATQEVDSIVYVSSPADMTLALESAAACCVCQPDLVDAAAAHFSLPGRCLLSAENVYLAMARINTAMFRYSGNLTPFDGDAIHPRAVVHPSATLGSGVIIGPNTTVGANTTIGTNTVIGPNVTIEAGVRIGESCHIHPQVYIAHQCELGDRVEVQPQSSIGTEGYGYAQDEERNHYRIPHFGRAILESDVHVGSGVCIDRGTYEDSIIKQGTKIDNHCHFAHNHSIGQRSLITAGFIMAGSTSIGENYVAGGRTSVNGHIQITDNVQTAGMSVVTKSISQAGDYAGYPLMSHKDHLRVQSILGKLPEMKRLLKRIKEKLDL